MAQTTEVYFLSFGGQKSEMEVLADLVSSEASPWLVDGHLLTVSSHSFSSACASPVSLCLDVFSSGHILGWAHPKRLFELDELFKGFISKYGQHVNLWGTGFSPQQPLELASVMGAGYG